MPGVADRPFVEPTIEVLKEFVFPLVSGLVATDGVVYSPVGTVGTANSSIHDVIIDLGFKLALRSIEVGLTQRFDNQLTNSVASLDYYWQVRSQPHGSTYGWVNIQGTYTKVVPTSGVAGDPAEDTFSGYLSVASLPFTPIRIELTARGSVMDALRGQVKNSSFIKLMGIVIPGT